MVNNYNAKGICNRKKGKLKATSGKLSLRRYPHVIWNRKVNVMIVCLSVCLSITQSLNVCVYWVSDVWLYIWSKFLYECACMYLMDTCCRLSHFYQLFVFVLSLHLQHLPSSLKSSEKEPKRNVEERCQEPGEISFHPNTALYFCRLFALPLPNSLSFACLCLSISCLVLILILCTCFTVEWTRLASELETGLESDGVGSVMLDSLWADKHIYISFVGINVVTHFIHGRKLCKDALS